MFCENCGAEINAGVKFCKKCGIPVNNANNQNSANNANNRGGSANYPNNNSTPGLYDKQVDFPACYSDDTPKYEGTMLMPEYGVSESAYDTTVYYKKKGIGKAGILSIVLGVIVALLIGVFVIVFMNYLEDGEIPFFGGGESSGKEAASVELSVDEAPSVTDQFEYIVSGTVSADGCDAELYVNGDYVKTIEDGSKDINWQHTVSLDRGENRIKVEFYDPNNKSETKIADTITIEKLKYLKGTKLYKVCKEGLRIRTSPSTTADKVLTLEYYEDYVPMVCLGEEHYGEGYTWCKVKAKGVTGWIGTDGNAEPLE